MKQLRFNFNQRWREGRASYRPTGEPINTMRHEVAAIDGDKLARAFVECHHYSGTYPSARFRFGLYSGSELVGVAVFSHPTNNRTLTNVFPFTVREAVELGRFVLLDQVASNGETWFLARCFEQLRALGILGVVSFSDDQPRKTVNGLTVFAGHLGTIYQAHNAVYLGRGVSRPVRILPDGTVLSARAIQKIRAYEVGWRYAAGRLEKFGATRCPETDSRSWLSEWLPILTSPMPHPGNHKYAWTLERRHRCLLPQSLQYPKWQDEGEKV